MAERGAIDGWVVARGYAATRDALRSLPRGTAPEVRSAYRRLGLAFAAALRAHAAFADDAATCPPVADLAAYRRMRSTGPHERG